MLNRPLGLHDISVPALGWSHRLPGVGYYQTPEGVHKYTFSGGVLRQNNFKVMYPEGATSIYFTRDLLGRAVYGWVFQGYVHHTYFDDWENVWITLKFEATSATALLDGLVARETPPIDITVLYTYGGTLYARYQRDRYTVPHEIYTVPNTARLRYAGIVDGRVVVRFMESIDGS